MQREASDTRMRPDDNESWRLGLTQVWADGGGGEVGEGMEQRCPGLGSHHH